MVNEPWVFEPLKFYCIILFREKMQGLFIRAGALIRFKQVQVLTS